MTRELVVFCIAAFLVGLVLGYVLHVTIRRNPKPDAKELGALIGVVFGGVVMALIKGLIQCPSALAWYLIGVAIGFFLYLVALHYKWDQIQQLIAQGKLKVMPFFPWAIK